MGSFIPPESLVSLIVAVSFAAGLNVYATVFSLGLMAHLHWVHLPSGLQLLDNPWCMGASGLLFAGEFFADKIPGVDLVWNALHTFVRIPVAALLAYSASSQLSPELHVAATAAGAAFAALAHTSKMAARLAVTPSPEPVSNIALSSLEDAVVVGLVWLALHYPIVTGISVMVFGTVCAVAMVWGVRLLIAAVRGLFRRDEPLKYTRPVA